MNLVMLSQDMALFDAGSPAATRIRSYGSIVDVLTVIVFGAGETRTLILAPNVSVIAAGGQSKLDAFFKGRTLLIRTVKDKKPNLVSVQDPFFIGTMALMVARSERVPVQMQVHTDCMSAAFAFASFRNFAEAMLAFFSLKGASCIRVVSERVAKKVRAITNAPVAILPIRVSDIPSEALARPAVMKEGRYTAVAVSRLTREKRPWLLVDAVLRVPDVDLVFVGDGPLRTTLERQVKSLHLENRVTFAGWQNPDPYYQHADVFVHASQYEGFGMSLVEAALHKLPVVTTAVGIVGDVLKDKQSALVVPGAAHAFADALHTLKNDASLRERLGEAACKSARASLVSESTYLLRYQDALRTCLS